MKLSQQNFRGFVRLSQQAFQIENVHVYYSRPPLTAQILKILRTKAAVLRLPQRHSNGRYSDILFMPTLDSPDSPILFSNLGVLSLPKGVSDRRYSNLLFLRHPWQPRYFPILRAKPAVLRLKKVLNNFSPNPPYMTEVQNVLQPDRTWGGLFALLSSGGLPSSGVNVPLILAVFLVYFYMFLPHKMAVGQKIFKWKILNAKVITMWTGWFWVDSGIFATFAFCNIFYLEMLLVAPPKCIFYLEKPEYRFNRGTQYNFLPFIRKFIHCVVFVRTVAGALWFQIGHPQNDLLLRCFEAQQTMCNPFCGLNGGASRRLSLSLSLSFCRLPARVALRWSPSGPILWMMLDVNIWRAILGVNIFFPFLAFFLMFVSAFCCSAFPCFFCFYNSLLLCFSTFLLLCFFASLLLHCAVSLLLRFSAFPCFSAFPDLSSFSLLFHVFLLFQLLCLPAFLLLCFSLFFFSLILQIILKKHHVNKP